MALESDRSNKRQRVTSENRGATFRKDEADFEVGTSWRVLVLRLGERCMEFDGRMDPIDQMDLCLTVVSRNFDALKGELLPLLMQCAEDLPQKAPFYTTLVSLLNVDYEEFGASVVEHVMAGLQAAFETGECNKMRILLRLLALLSVAAVVPESEVLQVLSLLVDTATTHLDPTAGGNPNWQPRADFFVFCVLACLPFAAQDWQQSNPDDLSTLLAAVESYMAARSSLVFPALTVFEPQPTDTTPPQDYLEDLWDRIKACKEDSWKAESVPRPHVAVKDRLSSSMRHPLGLFTPPPPPPAATQPDVDADMDEGGDEQKQTRAAARQRFEALQEFPPRIGRLKLFPPAKTDAAMAPIDRFVVQEYLLDVLFYMNGSRKECASYLVGLPVPFRYEYVMAETVFSQLLLLPRPPFRPIYYTIVLVDLCKALPGAFPAVLAGAVRALFSRAAIMDVECRTRVIQWLAHHLSNFAFVWPWAAWAAVARQPEWAPQRVFVSEVLEREIRLSYYDKIRESLGSAEMEQLLPPKPEPIFKFKRNRAAGPGRLLAPAEGEGEERGGEGGGRGGEQGGAGGQGRETGEGKDGGKSVQQYEEGVDAAAVEVAEELIVMVRTKRAGKEVAAWVEENAVEKVGGERGRALDVVAQTLLVLGSKSITHSVTVLERYGLALQLLAPDQLSQVHLLHSIWSVWANAPQMAAVVIDRCLGFRLVSPLALLDWCFLPSQYELYHTSERIWEILRTAVSKATNRLRHVGAEVAALERASAVAAAAASKAHGEWEAATLAEEEAEGEEAKTQAAAKAEWAKQRSSKAQEEAVAAAAAVEGKERMRREAEEEEQALFISLLLHFATAISSRRAAVAEAAVREEEEEERRAGEERMEEDEGEDAGMEGEEDGDGGSDRRVAGRRKREEERRKEEEERGHKRRLKAAGEKEWMRCVVGQMRSLCRYYGPQVWRMLPAIQSQVFAQVQDPIIQETVMAALLC
ncbi:hypothetical protein CLOM_g20040 [Closterium sp. NIES-68]|nr:hypothetical protein CLOM_g20040 [Closterium sp. NIES-68]